jgi:nitrate reductase NapAB chaperone NapD
MADVRITLHPVDIEKAIQLYLIEACEIGLNNENTKIVISIEMEKVPILIETLTVFCDITNN